jgi:hypothetical protein
VNAARSCDLCGLEIGVKPYPLATPEKELQFCCEACRGIYRMLHGLEDKGSEAPPRPAGRGKR